ncbi:MAG: trypsin-like peptidase domain-containing protein [Polyangiaceae bacterium]
MRKTAVVLTALHNFHWLGPEDLRRGHYWNPQRDGGEFLYSLPAASGAASPTAHAFWTLFTPAVPENQWGRQRGRILPRNDYMVATLDGQQDAAAVDLAYGDTGLRLKRPYAGVPTTSTTAPATPGTEVMVAGYVSEFDPVTENADPTLTISTGAVLSDADARAALEALRRVGDEEGDVAYAPEVEFLVSAQAKRGMSGSGVFDRRGRLLGIAVRASLTADAPAIVRVVRLSYIEGQLAQIDAKGRARNREVLPSSCPNPTASAEGLALVE